MTKNNLSYQERELEILRNAVDKAQQIRGKKIVQSPEIKEIINIVESFLMKKKLVCYGGTAINNILPYEDQFYDKNIEIPDYDFFSPHAMNDAKELADLYYKAGYNEVEAKAGQHYGTYKVFVNFIPVADITHLESKLYKNIQKNSIMVAGIYYAPPNFLRMAMYLELSRPEGDVGRWEKVLKRLVLLNKNFPLKGKNCNENVFQRHFNDIKHINPMKIYDLVKNSFIDQGVVFFGGFAVSTYSHYMPKKKRNKLSKQPDFDVLSENPQNTATIVKERLNYEGIKNVSIHKHKGIGEIIAPHYEIRVGTDTVAFVYEPLACHSYNIVKIHHHKIKIATIDTLLSFFLAFLYSDRDYYDKDRILCMAQFLFEVQAKNRLEQKGVLRRFSINCFGKQETQESIRAEKTRMYKELQNKRNTPEYEEWFLRYVPHELNEKKGKKKKTKQNKKVEKKNKTKKKTQKPKKKKEKKAKPQNKAKKEKFFPLSTIFRL